MHTHLKNHKRRWGTLLIMVLVTSTLLVLYYTYQLIAPRAAVPVPAVPFTELFPSAPLDQPLEDIPCRPALHTLIRPPLVKRMGGLSQESFGYGYRPARLQAAHPLYVFPMRWPRLPGEYRIQCSLLGVSENGYLYRYGGGKIEQLMVMYSPKHTRSQKLVWFHSTGFFGFQRAVDAGYRAALSGQLALAYQDAFGLEGSPIPLPVP